MKAQWVTGDKVERAKPFASQVQAGNVFLVKGKWNKDYIHQHHNFPQSKLKDMVDASSAELSTFWHYEKRNGDGSLMVWSKLPGIHILWTSHGVRLIGTEGGEIDFDLRF